MGGGGHGHHEPFEVPHYSIYNNWQKFPELTTYNKRLERLGLTDPFIRNYVYKVDPSLGAYDPNLSKSLFLKIMKTIKPGFVAGFTLAATVIAIEETYTYVKYGYTSWTRKH